MKSGDPVIHPFHGLGTISTISPDGQYAVVRYEVDHDPLGTYRRTHRVSDLKTT